MLAIRPPVRPGRRRVVYLCAALAGVAAGLTIGLAARGVPGRVSVGARGAPAPLEISSCVIPAWVRANGEVLSIGGCGGDFPTSAQAVTVQVGQEIEVQMLRREVIPGSQRVLVPVYPLPRSTNSWVLARSFVSSAQATAGYTAMHPGHAALVTKAYCPSFGTLGSEPRDCPVIDVTVISGPRQRAMS